MTPSVTAEDSKIAHREWRPDVTVATVVQRGSQFLFVEERVQGKPVLNQPAGHLESGETLIAAAVRETKEETAWQIEIEAFLGAFQWTNPDNGRAFLRFAFAAKAIHQFHNHALDDGIIATHWLSREALLGQTIPFRSPLVLATLDSYLAGTRLPLSSLQWIAI